MRVGFVGLGRMGSGMAGRILGAGHELIVYDVLPQNTAKAAEAGARVAASLAELCAGRDVVITMLAEDAAVHAVVLGTGGLRDSLPPASIHLAMGTYGIGTIRTLAAAHKAAGQTLVAAPVLGRPDLAASGQLGIVSAGAAAALAACEPLLSVIGRLTFHAGDEPEAASAIKLANNLVLGCAIQAMGEAFSLVRKYDVEPQVLYDVLTEGLFSAPAYKTYGRIIVDESYDRAGSTIALNLKDANLIINAGDIARVPLPSGNTFRDRLLSAMAHGDADKDVAALALEQAREWIDVMISLAQRIVRHPQGVWARRALFQIHLWTGISIGLYVLALSLSGSAIVFRREIARLAWSAPEVAVAGTIMTAEELGAAVKKAYPRNEVASITFNRKPDRAAEVLMTRGQRRIERAFDPYSGKDLGAVGTTEPKILIWLVSFHDDLLAGRTGRWYNGVGAVLFTLLCLTGIVIWWPGVSRWWRSLIVSPKAGWRRVNWDLHSALGFWMFVLLLLWGVSGIYLAFPDPFTNLVDYLQPFDADSPAVRSGDEFLAWLTQIHFGRAYGTTVKWIYTIIGLAPALLFITGGIMWWNRSLRPMLKKGARPVGSRADEEHAAAAAPNLELEA